MLWIISAVGERRREGERWLIMLNQVIEDAVPEKKEFEKANEKMFPAVSYPVFSFPRFLTPLLLTCAPPLSHTTRDE